MGGGHAEARVLLPRACGFSMPSCGELSGRVVGRVFLLCDVIGRGFFLAGGDGRFACCRLGCRPVFRALEAV